MFKAHTGMLGGTEHQKVTPENIHELPPGSVVVNGKDSSRFIHLHDDLWLWCSNGAHCYDRIENLLYHLDKDAYTCHIP